MSVLNEQAAKAAKKFAPDNAVIDPGTVSVFAELIFQFIAALQECKSAREAHSDIQAPKLFQRIRARMILKENLNRRDFRLNADKFMDTLYETGKEMTLQDVEKLYEEV